MSMRLPPSLVAALLLVILGACALSPFGSGGVMSGVYVLEARDGGAVVEDGLSTLDIHSALGDDPPLYGWNAVSDASRNLGEKDAGRWSPHGDRIRFESLQGNGTYDGLVAASAGGIRIGVHARSGHAYTYRLVRPDGAPSGYLRVSVVAESGGPVAGATLLFRAPDGLPARAGTAGGPPYMTAGPVGEWTVTVVPPAGYVVAAGQPNPARVTVTKNATAEVRFVLARVP